MSQDGMYFNHPVASDEQFCSTNTAFCINGRGISRSCSHKNNAFKLCHIYAIDPQVDLSQQLSIHANAYVARCIFPPLLADF